MNRIILLIIISAALFAFAFFASSEDGTKSEKKTYEGYLLDKACGDTGRGLDGSDVLRSPADHSVHCIQVCVASGLGISIESGKVYKFILFDKNGNELAKKLLASTKRTRGLYIQVEGSIKDKILEVASIKEIEPKKT